MFVGGPSLSLCMLSTRLRGTGPDVWPLLERVAWAGSLSQERGGRLFWTKRGSPRLEELCLLAAVLPRGGRGQEELSQGVACGPGVTVHPTVALGPQLEILGPCHGWEEPAWPGVLPPQAPGGRVVPARPSLYPLPKSGRSAGLGQRLLSQSARNVLASPSYTLPLPAPTSPSSPGAARPGPPVPGTHLHPELA